VPAGITPASMSGRKLQLLYLFKAWKDAVVVAACAAFIFSAQEENRKRGRHGFRRVYARPDWENVEWMRLYRAAIEEHRQQILQEEQQQHEVEAQLQEDLWMDDDVPPVSRNQQRFQAITRLPVPLFQEVVGLTKEHNLFEDRGVDAAHRPGVPTELRLMIVLNILGEGRFMRGFEVDQGVSMSSAHVFFHTWTSNFVRTCYTSHVYWPQGQRMREIERTFAAVGFPGCVGSIDVTHLKTSMCTFSERPHHVGKEGEPTVACEVCQSHESDGNHHHLPC
jgi:hypothetical protein